jgi:phage terminase large subunit-like protein
MPPSASLPSSAKRTARKRCAEAGCRKLSAARSTKCQDHKRKRAGQKPAKLYGCTEARLFTRPLRPLNRNTSRGYDVIEFARLIGANLTPWQEWFVIHALELNPDGTYRFRVVLLLVGRQNGKSTIGMLLTLYRMYIEGVRTVLGVAQGLSLAREQWSRALDTIRASPDLNAELAQVRNVNGDEWIRLESGSRYLIRASTREAGRGLSIDHLIIDELREWRTWEPWSALYYTTMARPAALILAMSNAGDDQSVVLNRLRESALAEATSDVGLFEWSAPQGCELNDRKAWAQSNPGLGHTISEAAIATAMATAKPDVFRTEVLCMKVDALDSAIDAAAWKDCSDPAGNGLLGQYRDRIAVCVDVSYAAPHHVTVAVAAKIPDGRVRIEIAGAWDSTDAARPHLAALLDKIKATETGWFPSGPAAAIAPILRARAGSRELKGAEVAEACQSFADLVIARQVLHNDDPLLNAHIGAAQQLPSGDGWRFVRRSGTGHVDGAYAAAGVVQVALTMPEPKRARIRVLSA